MEAFQAVIGLIQTGLNVYGAMIILWGGITLATGMKDHNGQETEAGSRKLISGVLILLITNAVIMNIKW